MYRGVCIFHPCFVQLFAGPFFSLKFAIERLFWEVWLCWHWYLCVNWSIVAWPEVRSDLFTLLEISRGEYYVHYLFLEFSFGNILKWQDGVFVTIVFCSYLQDTSSFWRLFWDVLEVDLWRWLWCELMLSWGFFVCKKSDFKDQDIAAGVLKGEWGHICLIDVSSLLNSLLKDVSWSYLCFMLHIHVSRL